MDVVVIEAVVVGVVLVVWGVVVVLVPSVVGTLCRKEIQQTPVMPST